MKTFNSNWEAKFLEVNFNQKQWRQDIAAFIRSCKQWGKTRVSRSIIIEEQKDKTLKEFKIFNEIDNNYFFVKYYANNKLFDATDMALVEEYLKGRV